MKREYILSLEQVEAIRANHPDNGPCLSDLRGESIAAKRAIEYKGQTHKASKITEWTAGELLVSGVYVLVSEEWNVLYIGQSQNVYCRLSDHMISTISNGAQAYREAKYMVVIPSDDPRKTEWDLLTLMRTKYNRLV